MNLEESIGQILGLVNYNLNQEFYIVDCYNFVFYPKTVKITGIGGDYERIYFYINEKQSYSDEERYLTKEELLRFKTFQEAEEYARELNNKPENKKRAEMWNSPQTTYKLAMAGVFNKKEE